jgi:hypothetical protein
MEMLFALALAATTPALVDHPQTYLASITDIPLRPGEALDGFSVSTWGVRFTSVCHIPGGWTIKAGGGATHEGVLEGEASLGATWLRQPSPSELRSIVLITFYAPVQRHDIGKAGGSVYVPATFKGHARLWADDAERKARLTYINVQLTPATRCPTDGS